MTRLRAAIIRTVKGIRARVRPDVRDALDSFGVLFAVTLLFCLIAAAHDGIVNRNRDFDAQRWWYPIYRTFAR
ncbi:hypothetical protein SAMN05443247_04803 [Bradyrhizobium erythrophlei]|jgi:hypothetical protein|nr:hypothetical protein SAMN05443247_04803 [Bradyrhizobium erythrophlei]